MSEVDQKRAKESLKNNVDDSNSEDAISEALSDVIEKLTDENSVDMFSELSMNEIRHLSALASSEDEVTRRFTESYKRLKISHRRAGREELMQGFEAVAQRQEDEEEQSVKDNIVEAIR